MLITHNARSPEFHLRTILSHLPEVPEFAVTIGLDNWIGLGIMARPDLDHPEQLLLLLPPLEEGIAE